MEDGWMTFSKDDDDVVDIERGAVEAEDGSMCLGMMKDSILE